MNLRINVKDDLQNVLQHLLSRLNIDLPFLTPLLFISISHLSIHVAYIEGKMNRVADALSRRPCYRDEKEILEENRELGLHHIEAETKIDIPI